jgi:uncharacterized protein YigA (DUF484 family)
MDVIEIKEELSDIKKEIKELAKVLVENKILEQKLIQLQQQLIASNAKHDEGRKVLHKRLDNYAKIIFAFGSALFGAMSSVIWYFVTHGGL